MSRKIPILDLSFSAYQYLKGNIPELEKRAGRIVFLFEANDTFYELANSYNENSLIGCLDFAGAIREMKAKMLAMKGNVEISKEALNDFGPLS